MAQLPSHLFDHQKNRKDRHNPAPTAIQKTATKEGSKKLFIKTYGCQMNVYDTQRMTDALAPSGYEATENADEADMVILNTCHIREKAAEKIYSELGRMRKMIDDQNKGLEEDDQRRPIVAVAGCVAQAEGREIIKRAPLVDMVFGPQSYHKLPEMVGKIASGQRKVLDTDFPTEDKFDNLPEAKPQNIISRGYSSFLTIQEGCDKFCTFCVVPYTRGAEYSRSLNHIMAEAQSMVDAGVREITLLGQNVNAFHGTNPAGETISLGGLMAELDKIKGLERIRYTTSHPNDMDQELLDIHRDLPSAMPYLHLPVQSGSNKILEAMNRRHTRESYFEVIEKLREARPDIALSGDFIVGFPGETDEDFEDTMDLIRRVKYAQAFSFKYSPRPGTKAAAFDNHVDDKVASDRLQKLQALLNEQQREFNVNTIGKTVDVLFERKGREEGQLVGKSPYLQPVFVDAPAAMIGQIAQVKMVDIGNFALKGELV